MAKRCVSPFCAPLGGVMVSVAVGDVFADNHPILVGRDALFEDVEAAAIRATVGIVEQATAAPGERRAVRKPAP